LPNNTLAPDTTRVGGDDVIDSDGQPTRILKLIRVPLDMLPGDDQGRFLSFDPLTAPFANVRELELHNFYQLPGQRIDVRTFKISFRRGSDDPPVTTIQRPGKDPVPYLEAVGLDNVNETGGSAVPGHDEVMDHQSTLSSGGFFLDDVNGILFLPDPRPFAPRIGTGGKPFDQAVSNTLFRRDSLVGPDHELNEANPSIYDKRIVEPSDVKYWIDLDFTAAQVSGEINLGRSNIIEGSDAVTVNGVTWVRNRDYRIDYDLGKVTLIKQPGPGDQVNVDYSYAPLFQQAGRTLLGSAFSYEGRDKHFGGAFLYESEGAQDLRPRLGEEPSRVVIGDLNTEWHFRPDWMTRIVDRLPGIRTTAPSEFNISAEAGLSLPNPNTKNEVFIDDMEGVRDAVSLALDPLHWRLTSLPLRMVGGFPDSIQKFQKNTEVRWYSPLNAVKERDLKPSLTDGQGAQNTRQVLALSLPRRPADWPNPATQPLWAGLTYVLDPIGVDLSKSQFIDLWVDDFNDFHDPTAAGSSPRVRGNHVKLHIDLGVVSEDQMRAPNVLPNGHLDTEDTNNDGQLTVTDQNNEDTGTDQKLDPAEIQNPPVPAPDLTSAFPGDPEGDDFENPIATGFNDIDPRKWERINGTEGNKNVLPAPDSEDLNGNGTPDFNQSYFEYTIDLGDTSITNPYLVTDVAREFSNYANTGDPLPRDNGWRRFRIPIADSLRVKFGSPDLAIARHVRVWLEDIHETNAPAAPNTEQRPFVMIGGVEIAGSRWQAVVVDSAARAQGTTMTLNSVNTVDNADDYVPPFDPGKTVNGNQEVLRREQSLALEFTNLAPGTTLEAFKTFSLDEDYSRYGNVQFFVSGFEIRDSYDPNVDSLSYFVRFASDEQGRNYYEYRRKVPASSFRGSINWQNVQLALTDLSVLKLNADFPKVDPIYYVAPGRTPDETFIISGRPSFTRLRRISIGLLNGPGGTRTFSSGQLWVDEIRSTDVAKDMGHAQRVTIGGRMANLLSYNLAYTGRDENFQSVGETRGSGNNNASILLNGTLDLHRFFEATGIVLPVSFSTSINNAQPRFTAGDDVIRTGALAEASETHSETRTISTSYARQWSERANPLLRYTIGGITANVSLAETKNRTPTTVDTTKSLNANVGYSVAPKLAIPLGFIPHGPRPGRPPGTPVLRLLPQRVYWNYAIGTSKVRSYDRLRDSTGSLQLRNATDGRIATLDYGADSQPIDLLHHTIAATRNLTLPEAQREQVGIVNFGHVVRWRQGFDSRYSLERGPWLKPTLSWNTTYTQNNGPELSEDLSIRAITNSQSLSIAWDLPFDRIDDVAPSAVAPQNTFPKTPRGPRAWRRWLASLGVISADAGLNDVSGYSRVKGTPDLWYLVGVTKDPGIEPDTTGRVQQQFGNASATARDWHAGARTRLLLLFGASLTTKADYRRQLSNYNDVTSRTDLVGFPDLDLDYGRIADVIGLSKVLTNPKLRSVYRRSSTTLYSNSADPTSIANSSQWQPLLGLTGDFKSGTRAEFRVERRVTERKSFPLETSVSSVVTDRNTDVNASLSRSYTQGQKIVFLGKESTIRSSVTWRLSGAYSLRSGETIQTRNSETLAPQFQVKEDRLSVNAGGSYGFSDNVTGNVDLGYSQNRDLQKAIVRKSVRVALQAQFTF
jgi:Motility related/secretion protein